MSGIQNTEWNENDVLDFLIDNGIGRGIFYDMLETSDTSKSYDEYCGTAQEPLQNNRLVRNICATILNYLETIYSKSEHQNDAYDTCKLLNYWVYNRLNIVLHSYISNNPNYVNLAHAAIVGKWNDFNDLKLQKPKNKTCEPIGNIVAYRDWEKRKELYEYYVDYSTIKPNLNFYPQICNKFYKYVESKKPLYKHFKERCTIRDTNRCPDFYDQCKQYDPEKVLRDLHCNDGIRQESDTASFRVPRIRSGDSVNEPDSEEGNVGMMPVGPSNLNGNPKTVENVGNILLGVVATTMTSGALYRFTPLGGMIRNGLGWNNNNMRNFNGGDIGLYDYTSESFNPYPGEEHYIGYHPA
ncbi:Plasmodium vivax Vir protein, putative [Plasmodium vivax]|uniref:Vir protein, putative n=1 Tax=Plasmodium vivax TaxID=5855 RepID=A0A1G4E6C0_PLAVI|nr:Plasmodium vivax Vir protein, putative [Plasmodium vivax]